MAKPAVAPFGSMRDWLRTFAIALLAGLFLTLAGAFGSGDLPVGLRLGYWMTLMAAGSLWGGFVARYLFRGDFVDQVWLRAFATAFLISAPFTLVVWTVGRVAFGRWTPLAELPVLFASVAAVSLAITSVNVVVARSQLRTTDAGEGPPKFLERLPLKLRGGELWAVQAEDHYLRLHTSKGSDLILMRLSDAVSELQGIEGAQTHRSWWVAREAITAAERGDGRAVLTLKDGTEVPVSRTYAKALRERRWY